MKAIATLILSAGISLAATAQTTITNGGFELWGNTVPSGDANTEPTNWYSDQSGSTTAALGPETCFKDSTAPHSGTYCVKVETELFSLGGIITEYINGVVTTGVVNAPTTSKADGYIGTQNSSDSATDVRRMAFTGRPDSLVGWYQYTQSTTSTGTGGPNEQGKIRAILHTGQYYDPETPTTYHPACIANKIADALFLTPMSNVGTWTRFSVPFTYVSTSSPAYIMINVTSSANQLTSVAGSILLLDDLSVVYPASSTCDTVTGLTVGSITGTGAALSWTAVSGSTGYVYAVNTSATPPASGTFTLTTSAAITGLTAATLYYAHVYDSCAVGSSSAWVTKAFGTTGFTGINNVTNGNFSITAFPNPAKDELSINISGAQGIAGQVQLMDMSGRLISTTATSGKTLTLSMNGLVSGIYIIRYIDATHTQTIKVTKE